MLTDELERLMNRIIRDIETLKDNMDKDELKQFIDRLINT